MKIVLVNLDITIVLVHKAVLKLEKNVQSLQLSLLMFSLKNTIILKLLMEQFMIMIIVIILVGIKMLILQ